MLFSSWSPLSTLPVPFRSLSSNCTDMWLASDGCEWHGDRGTDKQIDGAGFQISVVRRKLVWRECVLFTRLFCCQLSPRAHLHVVGMLQFMYDINQPSLPTHIFCICVYFCLCGPFNCLSLYESYFQPWYNPWWLTGLKTPITYLTN